MRPRKLRVVSALCALLPVLAWAQAVDDGPCGIPPPPAPKRIKGGEGVPPLPLPATPLRRTERKRDPAPPVLIGKVMWGKERSLTLEDGRTINYTDWNLDPNDRRILDEIAPRALGVKYRMIPIDPGAFSFDPAQIPFLYVSGVRAVGFAPEIRAKMRAFCEKGGFLYADACRGSPVFADAMRQELHAIFPDRTLRVLPPDHPLFSAHKLVNRMQYSPAVGDRPDGAPFFEGVDIGCRTVAILSKYGLSCAWDSDHVRAGSQVVVGEDARTMGLNLISYALGTFDLGRFYAQGGLAEPFAALANGDFVFAQLLHEGHADPDPSAYARLLEYVMANTSVGLKFARRRITADDPALSNYPFLYVTGHYDFSLSEGAVQRLRQHLSSGGFLLADACCGSLAFDGAFRREMRRVFPDAKLAALSSDHPFFNAFYRLDKAELTPKAQAAYGSLAAPHLEGIERDGALCVVYSPLDLGNGWEGVMHPYARGYQPQCALKIGVNAILYALGH